MFSKKSKKDIVTHVSINEEFLEGIKKDMTNRAAIAAKQAHVIENLLLALEEERAEMRKMRILYEKKMKQDDKWIDRFILLLEKRKQ